MSFLEVANAALDERGRELHEPGKPVHEDVRRKRKKPSFATWIYLAILMRSALRELWNSRRETSSVYMLIACSNSLQYYPASRVAPRVLSRTVGKCQKSLIYGLDLQKLGCPSGCFLLCRGHLLMEARANIKAKLKHAMCKKVGYHKNRCADYENQHHGYYGYEIRAFFFVITFVISCHVVCGRMYPQLNTA